MQTQESGPEKDAQGTGDTDGRGPRRRAQGEGRGGEESLLEEATGRGRGVGRGAGHELVHRYPQGLVLSLPSDHPPGEPRCPLGTVPARLLSVGPGGQIGCLASAGAVPRRGPSGLRAAAINYHVVSISPTGQVAQRVFQAQGPSLGLDLPPAPLQHPYLSWDLPWSSPSPLEHHLLVAPGRELSKVQIPTQLFSKWVVLGCP